MKLSKEGEYAIRALIYLGLAADAKKQLVQTSEVAEAGQIPLKFLERIFQNLKGARYLKSTRGKYGGYFLAKPTREIGLGEIIRLIDGPLAPLSCVSQSAYRKCTCPDEGHCGLRMIMLDVRNAITTILDRHTIADAVEISLRNMRRDGIPNPFSAEADPPVRVPAGIARRLAQRSGKPRISPDEGVLHQLLIGDYSI
jgi:Rrf2 family protein